MSLTDKKLNHITTLNTMTKCHYLKMFSFFPKLYGYAYVKKTFLA